MTIRQIEAATRGERDVVRDPKPTAKAHWKRSVRSARLYANQWAREWVKAKYSACVTCGSRSSLEWAHVLSGKGDAVRWEECNMTRQCTPCNNLHEFEPEHLIAWFLKTYGQPALFALTVKANTNVKFGYAAVMKIGDKLREKMREVNR
jgi:hypothetical protein